MKTIRHGLLALMVLAGSSGIAAANSTTDVGAAKITTANGCPCTVWWRCR